MDDLKRTITVSFQGQALERLEAMLSVSGADDLSLSEHAFSFYLIILATIKQQPNLKLQLVDPSTGVHTDITDGLIENVRRRALIRIVPPLPADPTDPDPPDAVA